MWRDFSEAAIPFCYRKARLDPILFEEEKLNTTGLPTLEYLWSYATYLVIDSELHWDSAVLLLTNCQQLTDLE